ncbi:864_t:CDS:2 [Dentiscutata erythropus]|uniref:864_t:CDS:1 n=1 Tax=Dentiscutata erythropus TaxID=1348616 RepID=A0A9N9NRQ0_9GLOM|nr:864_t:CDS:2 [Dentiscutata erythropus]
MNERKPKNIVDAFIENDLIDFRCVEEEVIKNDEVKDDAKKVVSIRHCDQDKVEVENDNNGNKAPDDVVLELEKIVKDLLKELIDDNFDEFDCGVDLSKWYWHTNFRDLDDRIVG